jgi:hypothetical protein
MSVGGAFGSPAASTTPFLLVRTLYGRISRRRRTRRRPREPDPNHSPGLKYTKKLPAGIAGTVDSDFVRGINRTSLAVNRRSVRASNINPRLEWPRTQTPSDDLEHRRCKPIKKPACTLDVMEYAAETLGSHLRMRTVWLSSASCCGRFLCSRTRRLYQKRNSSKSPF